MKVLQRPVSIGSSNPQVTCNHRKIGNSFSRTARLKTWRLATLLLLGGISSALMADTQKPSDVTGLSGTAISSTSVRLNWNASWDDQGVAGYNIYRNDNYYRTVYDSYFVDDNVSPKSRYRYSVTAYDHSQNFSRPSSVIAVDTGDNAAAPPPPVSNVAPTTPSNLRAESVSSSELTLVWDGSGDGYNVYRNDSYYTTVRGETRFTDRQVSAGETYRYDVVAFDPASNFSAHSDELVVTASAQANNSGSSNSSSSFSDITDLSATSENNSVRLNWGAVGGGTLGYNVYRNNSYVTTVKNSTEYSDTGVSSGNTYTYYIVAYKAQNVFTNPGNKVSVTVTGSGSSGNNNASGPLSAPSNLQGEADGSSAVNLSWSQPSGSAVGYNVYRNDSYHSTIHDTKFTDTGVANNSVYKYSVVAFDSDNNFSAFSAPLSITVGDNGNNNSNSTTIQQGSNPNGPLSAPRNLRSETLNANQVMLYWDAPESGVAGGYNLYQDNAYIGTIYANTYQVPWLESGRDYRFHVIAFDTSKSIYSSLSASIYANTNRESDNTINTVSAGSSVPDGYNLIFSDEFQGSSIDSSKWITRYKWGPDWLINGEKQYYVDIQNFPDFGYNPFSFDGEHVTISAVPTPDWLKSSAKWQPYLSGVLNTYNKFKMKYGYVEIRAKLPKSKGLWSAFWLLHQHNNDRRPEIDVVEMIGDKPHVVYQTYHYYNNGNLVSGRSNEVYGPDYSQDFHTYGVLWEPGKVTWYVDGRETHVLNDGNVSWEEMYLITNLAVGGWWPGDPDGSTQFPGEMKIDYIRAYQR